jgi:eukaryotic-like serine/threonine-protein kinase
MSTAQAPQTVNRLGPYQLLAKIGEGGISTVHLGIMEGPAGFSKLAAVKELHHDLNASNKMRALFIHEMRLAARLAHPNVVHTYGANEDSGRLYLAMEYLDGQPWSRIRRMLQARGTLPIDLHLKVIAEVLAGLHYAHELREYDGSPLQVVHCDVSPQNVLVTYEGLVKVVDFGVARAVFRGDTASEAVGGKLAYIAPEQLRGAEFDRRADVFAVGVMLWEALTGRRFAQTKDGVETRRRRESGMEPRMAAIAPAAASPVVKICDRALALDPADRFATAAEFREALLEYLEEDMRDVDRLRLDVLVSDAFKEDRARIQRILHRYLVQPTSVTSSMEQLLPKRGIPQPAKAPAAAEVDPNPGATRRLSPPREKHEVPPSPSAVPAAFDQHAVATRPLSPPVPPEEHSSTIAAWLSTKLGPTFVDDAHELLSVIVQRQRLVLPLVGVGFVVLGFTIATIWSSPETDAHASRDHASTGPALTPQVSPTAPAAAHPNIPTTSTNVAPNPTESAERARDTVRLSIAAYPKSVRLYLDGVPLAENPYTARLRADQQVHIIHARSSDRVSQTRAITFDRDQAVSFDLDMGLNARSSRRTRNLEEAAGDEPLKAVRGARDVEGPRARPQKKTNELYVRESTKRNRSRPIYENDPYR